MKKCTRCEIEKDLSDFNRRTKSRDGYNQYCRLCMKKNVEKRYWEGGVREQWVAERKKNRKPLKHLIPRKIPQYVDLAYIAGFADAEGSFCLVGTKEINPSIQIYNSDRPVLEWIQEQLGGSIIAPSR